MLNRYSSLLNTYMFHKEHNRERSLKYGPNVFYAKLDVESFFNHGHDLFLTDNGVVLCYEDIAPMYLTFHYRPPHEQDPGGLKHEEKQRAAGVSSSFDEETPSAAADSSEATGGSPSGEVPVRRVQSPPREAPPLGRYPW